MGYNWAHPNALNAMNLYPLQWDRVENKTTVVLYGAGALVALWFSSTLVTALNSIPVVSVLQQ